MKKPIILAVASIVILSGCESAIVSNQQRDFTNQTNEMRCITEGTDSEELNAKLATFDGWQNTYISEYTTGNKVDTVITACFERTSKEL